MSRQTDRQWSRKVVGSWKLSKSVTFSSLHLLPQLEHRQKQQQHPLSQALQLPPSTHPAFTHSPLRRGLMSNKHWVTTVLESSQLSQMPNWSLEVLHNAKQHSLKLGGKKKKPRSCKMQKCTKMHFRSSSVAVFKWLRWIIRTLRRPLAGEITRRRKWAPKHTHDPKT